MPNFVLYLLGGILGAWLINYLSDVLPISRGFTVLRCGACQTEQEWWSYLSYARCRSCGEHPSRRHWIVLLTVPALSLLVGLYPAEALGSWGTILWLVYFGLVTVIDLEHRLILHPVSLAGAGLGLAFGIAVHGALDTIVGGGAGFGIMLAFYFLGEAFISYLSRRKGQPVEEVALGFGDVNLAGIMGLLLGWPGVIGGIFLAVVLGGAVSGLYLLFRLIKKQYRALEALPYGPFIALSSLAMFYLASLG